MGRVLVFEFTREINSITNYIQGKIVVSQICIKEQMLLINSRAQLFQCCDIFLYQIVTTVKGDTLYGIKIVTEELDHKSTFRKCN